MPGTKWKRSLKNPGQYERLREKGLPKDQAARISNARPPTKGKGK
jgi:hypothetical protein